MDDVVNGPDDLLFSEAEESLAVEDDATYNARIAERILMVAMFLAEYDMRRLPNGRNGRS